MNKKIVGVIAVVALLSVGFFVSQYLKEDNTASSGTLSLQASIPTQVDGFRLDSVITGDEAIQNISRLHGTDIEIVDGLVAEYASSDSHFVVWISQSSDEQEAKYLLDIMDEKIPASPVFTNRQEFVIGDTTYYYVTGAGMENYYWYKGTKVYWVGITSGNDMEILRTVINSM
ncbi:MAG: hypothetical protein SCK28_09350 [Bacillota bacterium]|nr:hypothetical protein [Bacillota bacterium]